MEIRRISGIAVLRIQTAPLFSNFEFSGSNLHRRFQILILGVQIRTCVFKF